VRVVEAVTVVVAALQAVQLTLTSVQAVVVAGVLLVAHRHGQQAGQVVLQSRRMATI
jgi:hypothetical protein